MSIPTPGLRQPRRAVGSPDDIRRITIGALEQVGPLEDSTLEDAQLVYPLTTCEVTGVNKRLDGGTGINPAIGPVSRPVEHYPDRTQA